MTTFTAEEVTDLQVQLAAAQAKLAEFDAAGSEAEVEARVAAATAEADEKATALQAQVDELTVSVEAAAQAHKELVDFLEGEQARITEEAEIEARKTDRSEQLSTLFSADKITENIDRWATVPDEEFAAMVADWTQVAEQAKAEAGKPASTPPAGTAMSGTSRETASTEQANPFDLIGAARRGRVNVKAL